MEAEHAERAGAEGEPHTVGWRESDPACGENPQQVSVRDQRHRAVDIVDPCDDTIGARADLFGVLPIRGTVLEDDPSLDVREVTTPRQPRLVVVDSRLASSERR